MLSVRRTEVALLFAIALATAAATARADVNASAASARGQQNVIYQFTDDPLAAGGIGPNDSTVVGHPPAIRYMLIRPRTAFVHEMLKSVENL
jgi:hypothetical protein